MVAKHGADMSYQLAPRAKIFRRDANDVTSFDEFKHIMRYNDYKVSAGLVCLGRCRLRGQGHR